MSKREHTNISSLTPLQYIESTGTQWIDTGFKLNNNSRVVVNYMVTQYQSNLPHGLCLFGARYANLNNAFLLWAVVNRIQSTQFLYGTIGGSWDNYNNLNVLSSCDANKNNWAITINNSTRNYNLNSQNFQNQGNCYLFKCNFWNEVPNNNGIDPDQTDGHLRIYSCDIYDNGTQVRQFRPYLNAGEGGMLDEINNVWYCNNGTGEFLYT